MSSSGDTIETLASGGNERPGGFRAAPATVLTTALSLVLTGGVVTAAVRGSGGAPAPATLVPSTAFAYAEVDLGLGSGQEHALATFLGHFPDAPATGDGSLRDRLLRAMFRDSSNPHVDYAKDVRPWLGDHVAVAGWVDAGRPQVEFVLQSTDDAAARSSLHRLARTNGVTFADGYAIVAQSQRAADDALAAARHASLAGSSTMSADVARLGSPQVGTGWVDAAGAMRAVTSAMHGLNPMALMPFGSMMRSPAMLAQGGRLAVGVRATGDYAELVARQVGGHSSGRAEQPTSLLTQLPDHTIAAAEVVQPGKGLAAGMSGVMAGVFGARASVAGATGWSPYRPSGQLSARPSLQTQDPLAQIRQLTGLSLPGDVETLLGPAAVIAYGGLEPTGMPKVAVRGRPADLSQAQPLAEHAAQTIRAHAPIDLAVTPAGSDLVIATSPGYASEVARGGALGDDPSFKTAMGGLPSTAAFAAYVRLAAILPLVAHGNRDSDHFESVGIWAGHADGGGWLQVRLVAR